MAEGSSCWKKPSDIMKIHRRRKSTSTRKVLDKTETPDTKNFVFKSPKKRKNPFSMSPSNQRVKRQHVNDKENGLKIEQSCDLFTILDDKEKSLAISGDQKDISSCKEISPAEMRLKMVCTEGMKHNISDSNFNRSTPALNRKEEASESSSVNKCSESLPVDWCLKNKLRITSHHPLAWCCQLKSVEEAEGLTDFVKGNKHSQVCNVTEQKKEFQRCCMYWIHPNLPWIKLYPRIVSESKTSISQSYLVQEEVQSKLQLDWEESFTSAFHQLRSKLCPYFYLCTHQFSVLFRNLSSGLSAMVTPTTRGFRETLHSEGINFKMPLAEGKKVETGSTQTASQQDTKKAEEEESSKPLKPEDQDDVDDLLDTDEGAHGWLESIGLDKKEFPTLDPRRVKMQREGFRIIDNRPESLVYVTASDVQALFNFLLNCRSCTATSGPQAGIPPTILSPTCFKGATLKSHKVKHSSVKQTDKEGNICHMHVAEVTGPILPDHVQSLVDLLHTTQQADFSLTFNNHEPTVAFNFPLERLSPECTSPTSGVDISRKESSVAPGLESNLMLSKHFSHKPVSDKARSICELTSTSQGFLWVA